LTIVVTFDRFPPELRDDQGAGASRLVAPAYWHSGLRADFSGEPLLNEDGAKLPGGALCHARRQSGSAILALRGARQNNPLRIVPFAQSGRPDNRLASRGLAGAGLRHIRLLAVNRGAPPRQHHDPAPAQ